MKDLLKTYAPVAFILVGAGIYWAIGSVGALKDTIVALEEQNKQIVIAITGNCEAAGFVPGPVEETEEDASTADTP